MQPGQVIGGYRVERSLGQGGMGAVFLARRPGQGSVALKVLLTSADPELLARFDREAKVLQRLNSPGIVRCLDYGLERGRPYIVQEFCEGGDLSGLLRTRGRLKPEEATGLVHSLCVGLEAAHQAGVVHRDLKPANVLLSAGQPKLTDFGLARAKGIDHRSLTATGVFLGTPAYMAPEQLIDAREVDRQSDVYALGVILYELLSGRRPFEGSSALAIADAVLNQHPQPLPGEVPVALQEIVARAMAREPEGRYGSAQELGDALLGLRQASASTRTHALLVPLTVVSGLLLFILVGLFALGGVEPSPSPRATSPGRASARARPLESPAIRSPGPGPSKVPASPPLALRPPSGGELGRALDDCAFPATRQRGLKALAGLADQGRPQACLAYGRLLLAAVGGARRDPERATFYLERAAKAGLPEADVLLSLRGSPVSWSKARLRVRAVIYARARRGERSAIDRLLSALKSPPTASKSFAEATSAPGPLHDLLAFSRFQGGGPEVEEQVMRELRASASGEAALVRAVIALRSPTPREAEPGLHDLLLRAYAADLPLAAEGMAEAIRGGSVEGTAEERVLWLRRAAIRGRAVAALNLWDLRPEERLWLRLAAAQANERAALRCAEERIRNKSAGRVQPWLEHASASGDLPRASALLAGVLVAQPDQTAEELARAETLAKHGASGADREGLLVYGRVLERRIGQGGIQAWAALEVLAGLASTGDALAALEAAKVARGFGLVEVSRSLLRRALAVPGSVGELERLTAGVPATAPVESQSQLVLRRRAKEGDRSAIVEIGRRADLELLGEERYQAVERAAATGDLRSRLRLAHLRGRSGHAHFDRAVAKVEYVAIAKAGLPEGWLHAYESGGKVAKLFRRSLTERSLRAAAKEGGSNGIYALGLFLSRHTEKVQEGRLWLEEARRRGEPGAAGALALLGLRGPNPERTLAELEAQPTKDQDHLSIGLAYLEGRGAQRDLAKAKGHLLLAALRGGEAEAYAGMGRALCREPGLGTAIGSVWLEAADQRGNLGSRFLLGSLLLERSEFGRSEAGLAKLEQLMNDEQDAEARLVVGKARLEGRGTRVDLPAAEEALASLEGSAEARALLGEIWLRTGRGPKGREALEAEVSTGNPYARAVLATALLRGSGGPQNEARGLKLLEEGAKRSEAPSCRVLGSFYKTGRYVEKDLEEARRLQGLAGRRR